MTQNEEERKEAGDFVIDTDLSKMTEIALQNRVSLHGFVLFGGVLIMSFPLLLIGPLYLDRLFTGQNFNESLPQCRAHTFHPFQ